MVLLSRVILLWRLHRASPVFRVLPAALLRTQCFVSPLRVLGALQGCSRMIIRSISLL
jgi:hypothetical protein